MIANEPIFQGIECGCFCFPDDNACLCGTDEAVIRGYAEGKITVPMTEKQREWCYGQVTWADEGSREEELIPLSDKDLGYRVLRAWIDYANSMY